MKDDWQDWNGDGKVTNEERGFTFWMMDDMDKRAGKTGGGCFTCILVFLVVMIGTVKIVL